MKKQIRFFIIFLVFPLFSFARGESCFPIGRARHDRECYDMGSKNSCLNKGDVFSCGWGIRNENPPDDDDLLVCDDSRCSNKLDGDDEDFADEEEPRKKKKHKKHKKRK